MGSIKNAPQNERPTKKMLVAFDPAFPNALSSDFLLPWIEAGQIALRGTRTGTFLQYGLVIYTGRPHNEKDLIARAVDLRWQIDGVDELVAAMRHYLQHLKTTAVGNVVQVHGRSADWRLEVVARSPALFKP